MSSTFGIILQIVIPILVMVGIWMMSRVPTATNGNRVSMVAMTLAILLALWGTSFIALLITFGFLAIGAFIGAVMSRRVSMIQMPQMVGLLNGLGGGASALVGVVTLMGVMSPEVLSSRLFGAIIIGLFSGKEGAFNLLTNFESSTAVLAILVGVLTLTGSLVAAGKLHRVISQKPIILKGHSFYLGGLLTLMLVLLVWGTWFLNISHVIWVALLSLLVAGAFGVIFTIRVGGADMPITISLLNSLSGVAGSIAGMAIGNVMLVAIGGIVGASGLLLTQIMCRSMNRSLVDILLGKTSQPTNSQAPAPKIEQKVAPVVKSESWEEHLKNAQSVIIVPGYGMALSQAQQQVKQLADQFENRGAQVRYAIHPVAGRMPGHMNVLLAEANVDYDELIEMEAINDDFASTDLVIVIGANDVLNPAARDAEGTPIYGMPVLNVDQAKYVIICNYDRNPGYAGVANPLYDDSEKVTLLLGDAKESLNQLQSVLHAGGGATTHMATASSAPSWEEHLNNAQSVIIVPGYGMALSQAQQQVKQLADQLESRGTQVRYAIHPVAGRMPGHMNVLLAEANVDYDELIEMEVINDDFASTDLVIVIGANDVLNPSARDAEGTPIYGMPVLNVDQAKYVIICNYDRNPGYAGVANPLYDDSEKVTLLLGDAKESLSRLQSALHGA